MYLAHSDFSSFDNICDGKHLPQGKPHLKTISSGQYYICKQVILTYYLQ